MDTATMHAAIEAQFLMGHAVPATHTDVDRRTTTGYSWNEDLVRQALNVPLNDVWEQRILELEAQGLASFGVYSSAACEVHPGWQDEPRDQWGSVDVSPRGVLRLAELYGRPYVKLEESPALWAHWTLVETESAARLRAPYDPQRWEREFPERARRFKAWLAQEEGEHGD